MLDGKIAYCFRFERDAFTIDAAMPDVNKPFAVIFGTSQRMIVDFADLEGSTWVNSTGQNGQLWHRHREDQIPKWRRSRIIQCVSERPRCAATPRRG